MDVAIEAVEAVEAVEARNQRNKNSNRRHKNKQRHDKKEQSSDTVVGEDKGVTLSITEEHLVKILHIVAANEFFWTVKAIFNTNNKYYVYVEHKKLTDEQIDVFEDSRINDSVMRGSKILGKDEYWKVLYRKELKFFQDIFGSSSSWVYDSLPDKKYKSILLWGALPVKQTQVDPDSQNYFLQRHSKKLQAKKNYRDRSSDELPIFG